MNSFELILVVVNVVLVICWPWTLKDYPKIIANSPSIDGGAQLKRTLSWLVGLSIPMAALTISLGVKNSHPAVVLIGGVAALVFIGGLVKIPRL